jgi:hypothetical protein
MVRLTEVPCCCLQRTIVELDDSMSDTMKSVIEQLEQRGKIAKPEGQWSEADGTNLLSILGSVHVFVSNAPPSTPPIPLSLGSFPGHSGARQPS